MRCGASYITSVAGRLRRFDSTASRCFGLAGRKPTKWNSFSYSPLAESAAITAGSRAKNCCAARSGSADTGRHPEHQSPRQAADGTAAAQATAGADALAEALQAARAAQQAAETAAAQAAAALRDAREQAAAAQAAAREQAAAPEGASALCAGEGLTGQDLVTAPNRGSGAAGTRARSHIPRSGCRRRHPGCCVITDVWAIHLSGPDENRPLDAVVMAARRTKILGLVRLTECPLLTLSGNTA